MSKEFIFLEKTRLSALINLFCELFCKTYHTQLVPGGHEPVYLPRDKKDGLHKIVFTNDYFSSALHEIAHWCIAGDSRRAMVDYGYWYCPDGRSAAQQKSFEHVEVKPQALERIFSKASGVGFHVSADNLVGGEMASEVFVARIHEQTIAYCREGLPLRADMFVRGLMKTYAPNADALNPERYTLSELT